MENGEKRAKAGCIFFGNLFLQYIIIKTFGLTHTRNYSTIMPFHFLSWHPGGGAQKCSIDNADIKDRVICSFLGVHRFAPTLSVCGDTGWIPSQYKC